MSGPSRLDLPNREGVERKIRVLAARLSPELRVDDLELGHLAEIATNHALLLNDLYAPRRLDRILGQDPAAALSLATELARGEEARPGEAIRRIRRIPDDVRVVGDKCLYDVGLFGRRQHLGLDLRHLGVRCYTLASEILDRLAADRALREFFKQNRLGTLPIEDEVLFLKQCAERFTLYADLLRSLRIFDPIEVDRPAAGPAASAAPHVAAPSRPRPFPPPRWDEEAAEGEDALEEAGPAAVRGEEAAAERPWAPGSPAPAGAGTLFRVPGSEKLPRRDLLSLYERLVLFANLDVPALRDELNRVVVDQEEAVDALCDELSLYATGTQSLSRPASFFLVGPTGVGKNHLVECFAAALERRWSIEIPVLLLEGPQYTYPSDINELKGAARGFIRSDEEGILTEFYGRASGAPLSIILVDEVEKAHPQFRKFFLGLMDRATTMDNRGDTLHFVNTIIFYTSNVGYSRLQSSTAPIGFADAAAREEFRYREVAQDLKRALTPEFVNRVSVIRFRPLTPASIERIFDLELEKVASRYREVQGIALEVAPRAREEIIRRGHSPEFGARPLARLINQVCNVEVSKRLKRDERRDERGTRDLLSYLREVREGSRPLDPSAVGRVLDEARAHVDYRTLVIDFDGADFTYASESPRPR
jgi:hypothetical protein